VRLSGLAPGWTEVEVRRGTERLAAAPVEDGRFAVDLTLPGVPPGPTRLLVRAAGGEGPAARALVEIEVAPPRSRPALAVAPGDLLPGLVATATDAEGRALEGRVVALAAEGPRTLRQDLERIGVLPGRPWGLEGLVQVASDGVHEVVVTGTGPIRLAIDRETVLETAAGTAAPVAVALAAGWHALRLEGQEADVGLRLGGAVPPADALAHLAEGRATRRSPSPPPPRSSTATAPAPRSRSGPTASPSPGSGPSARCPRSSCSSRAAAPRDPRRGSWRPAPPSARGGGR
jgi:hypothetical protein